MDSRFQHLTQLPYFECNMNFSSKCKRVVWQNRCHRKQRRDKANEQIWGKGLRHFFIFIEP